MERRTRTGPVVFGDGPPITVSLDVSTRPSIDAPRLCTRCNREVFSPVTWSHLRGETLNPIVPEGEDADFHIMNDLDFVIKMFCHVPRSCRRGPKVDFKIVARDIVQSSLDSCTFCRNVALMDVNGSILSKPDAKVVLRMQAFWPQKSNGVVHPMTLEIGLHSDMSGGGVTMPMVLLEPDSVSDQAEEPSPDLDLNLTGLFEQARLWLRHCESAHAKCVPVEVHELPTRVLDLAHAADQQKITLVETTGVGKDQYAMLSYVWGTSSSLRLSQDTRSYLMTGVKVDELPKAILDAIVTAHNLRVRYLWIDALCIAQDSQLDKTYEIARMAQYYSNATIVISASGAADVNREFLGFDTPGSIIRDFAENPDRYEQPAPEPPRSFRIPVHLPGVSGIWLANTRHGFWRYHNEPINRRAWTLQESVLPRRLLSFPSSGGIVMQCLEGITLAGEITSDPHDEMPEHASLGIVSSTRWAGEDVFRLWYQMIEDYTVRSLTHQDDILVAIGALARTFYTQHSAVLGTYVAGLWLNHVREGLLWLTDPETKEFQVEHTHAPSWSWASCDKPVKFHNEPEMYLPSPIDSEDYKSLFVPRWYCEIIECETTPLSPLDPFGAVKAGFLRVRGPLRRLRPYKTSVNGGGEDQEPEVEGDRIETSTVTSKDMSSPETADLEPYLGEWKPEIFSLDRISSLDWSGDRSYYWLGIWYAGRGRGRGLIVEQISQTEYRRVGFAEYMMMSSESGLEESDLVNEPVIRLV